MPLACRPRPPLTRYRPSERSVKLAGWRREGRDGAGFSLLHLQEAVKFLDVDGAAFAVYEDVERELVEQIAAEALSAANPLEVLHVGARAFLDAVEDPAVQRIALIDAPSVLGWEQWREIGFRYGFGLVQETLAAAMEAGLIERTVMSLANW